MKVVFGLGNRGEKYDGTRHNVGFLVLDRLGSGEYKIEKKFKSLVSRSDEVLFVKPQEFMNMSGESVSAVVNFYKVGVDDIYVVHDDLDIRLGEYKIQKGVGPKDHNGINDIEQRLGEVDFWRVRIGVDNRESREISGEEYVLGKFRGEEREVLKEVVDKAVSELIAKLGLNR